MQAITKVFSDIVKPYIDAEDGILQNQLNINGIVNVLPDTFTTQTIGSTTWTKESDGTVVATKTSSAASIADFATVTLPAGSYRLSGCPSGGSDSMYNMSVGISGGAELARDKGSTALFTLSETTTLIIKARTGASLAVNTQVHFKPMISFAFMDLSYDDYVPYAKSNQLLTKETTGLLDNTEVNGAVNMLPNNATSQVINGVTFTVNADGSVTASGTATAKATLQICSHQNHVFPDSILGKSVKISGSINTNNAYVQLYDPLTNTGKRDTTFTIPSNMNSLSWNVVIEVTSGTTVNGTFKPMITVASYNGDYVPYVKSNKELTYELTNKIIVQSKSLEITQPNTATNIDFDTPDAVRTHKSKGGNYTAFVIPISSNILMNDMFCYIRAEATNTLTIGCKATVAATYTVKIVYLLY